MYEYVFVFIKLLVMSVTVCFCLGTMLDYNYIHETFEIEVGISCCRNENNAAVLDNLWWTNREVILLQSFKKCLDYVISFMKSVVIYFYLRAYFTSYMRCKLELEDKLWILKPIPQLQRQN